MNLADFLEFDPFNELRASMNAEQLGQFELFNPALHLTGEERSHLARQGLVVERADIGRLLDHTLSYKNSRVAIVHDGKLHITHCPSLPDNARLTIATSLRPFPSTPKVCAACLQYLGYKGYDTQKARKERYNADVLDGFSLDEFWKDYPPYPLNRERELVNPID